ncbi:DNA internalization-related competence protein ComEC/Rec2 [Alkanindiges illinoisensis]|uniref:DNA internalization-related competence protein ComEC/Rec2 n=1 Tax=Alkanindiges illinoisensis TaxID=197183 RepID=UPI000B18454E|nr:DNA internalization-related competence protein ComEC/Rec2 [Alkanindiges illinoisensis]
MMILLGFIAGVITIGYHNIFSALLPVSGWLSSGFLLLLMIVVLTRVPVRYYLILHPVIDTMSSLALFGLAFIFGTGYAHWQLDHALQQRLSEPVEQTALVRVVGISDGVGEDWRQVVETVAVENRSQSGQPSQERWLLYGAFDWTKHQSIAPPDMQPGQLWQVRVKLKPAHSNASPGAFDVEKWLLQQHITATGTLQTAQRLTPQQLQHLQLKPESLLQQLQNVLQRERLRIRQHFIQWDANLSHAAKNAVAESPVDESLVDKNHAVKNNAAKGVLLGLLTGDRSLIDADTTLLYQQMGISHLLAISGPHVILAALIITWLLQKLLDRFPALYLKAERRRWLLPVFMLVVMLYAGLAGFDIPAQRTVLMVGLAAGLLWFRQRWSRTCILLMSASILLLLDPLAILSAAFWLSFGAVAILLSMSVPQPGQHETSVSHSQIKQRQIKVMQFVQLQWRLFVLLSPLVLLSFAKISWLAPLVNLLAIPLLSAVVLPVNLLAYAVSMLSPALADMIWQLALWLLDIFHVLLRFLATTFPKALQPFYLSPLQLLALFAMLVVLILPKGLLPRWWMVFLMIPACYPARPVAPLIVQVLDVGQGLSVILKTRKHAMLVDTGAKLGHSSMGDKVVIPALQAQGIQRLDKLMLTHLDSDHSGGAPAILQQLAVSQLTSSETFAPYPTYLCEAGQSWQWDGVQFRVLSPLPAHFRATGKITNSKNEKSCVLMVEVPAQADIPAQRVLIMGDAGLYTEFMLQRQAIPLQADLLILGHHGSQHSSSSPFLSSVQPQRAVVSAGYLNRYGHPKPIVLARLNEQGIAVDSTIDSGTLTYVLGQQKYLKPQRYRDKNLWLQRIFDQ